MNCRSAESLFSSYIEDEISQEERRALESHFMSCRRCSLAMRQVRATMTVLHSLPEVAVSTHFDEEVYARIRSGEGLRPSAAEIIRELFSPARLRPLFVAGAGACAVALAVMVSPMGQAWIHARVTNPAPIPPTRNTEPATVAQQEPASTPSAVVRSETPGREVAQGPAASTTRRPVTLAASAQPATRDSVVDGSIPRQRYQDEIINDQLYLERVPQGQPGQDPAVVPVNDTGDGVYIVF